METETPTPNVELLRSTLAWAEREAVKPYSESQWYQGDWVLPPEESGLTIGGHRQVKCQTAYCFAGWATAQTLDPTERMDEIGDVYRGDKRIEDCDERAARVLGIDFDQADALFDGGNDIEDVRRIVNAIITGQDL